jgi:hypothetical protein
VTVGAVTVTYPQVTSAGSISVSTAIAPTLAPPNIAVVSSMNFDVSSTAGFSGSATVTVRYDPQQIPGDENALQLWHQDGSNWENVTISRDTVNHTITGKVTHFSPLLGGLPATQDSGGVVAYGMNTNILLMLAISMISVGGYLLRTRRIGTL